MNEKEFQSLLIDRKGIPFFRRRTKEEYLGCLFEVVGVIAICYLIVFSMLNGR